MRRRASGSAVVALALAGSRRSSRNPSGLYVVIQDDRAGYIDREGRFVWNLTS